MVREPEGAQRGQARGRATRARLVDSAGEIFRSKGYAGTSIADVARKAGIGVGTVYHHFADKRAVLLALVDDWATRVEEKPLSEADFERFVGDDPQEAILRVLRGAYERERSQPSLYTVVLGLAERDPEVRSRYNRLELAAVARLREFIEFGKSLGIVRPRVDAGSAAFLIHRSIDMAATQLFVREVTDPSPDLVVEELADMFRRYLVVEGRRRISRK